eukprot:GFKZ01012240.1.p2 GENE.GFKZ01012240.1~~GFKZ01012240.1.p2  ORF type:complete len:220 (-),score=28.30 GFKZ01012240.1:1651-2310(-)
MKYAWTVLQLLSFPENQSSIDMESKTPAFALPLALPLRNVCSETQPISRTFRVPTIRPSRNEPRMEAAQSPPAAVTSITQPLGSFTTFPPPEMTEEWAEAVQRLTSSISSCTLSAADAALEAAEGDEDLALRYLTEENKSEVQIERERVVEKAREAGDVNRVSAIKEAELRRRATGSARDFFKGFVETEGRYVDQGYVDESADVMGKLAKKFGSWFGGK